MPGIPRIDFFDFLFNRGRGVKPTQVDWSEPDAELDAKIAAASQAAAVDQTARDAADAAQVDIDDHEANHPAVGVDQTARDAALSAQQAADTAQGAADTAQGEIDTHEASTHNTDTTARNRGTTARNEAQEAQTTVDDHIANHPGNGGGGGTPHTEQRVLQQDPQGTAATLGKFQIDPTGNAYGTVPDTELGVLATGDFTVFNHADYAGELDFEPNAQSFPLGEHYFLIVDHKLRVTIASTAYPGTNEWADGDWSNILLPGARYRGVRGNDAEALHHVQANGDVYYHRSDRTIRVVANFVAGSAEHTDYYSRRFAFVDEIPDAAVALFVERSTLPDPTSPNAPPLVHLTHDHREGNRADATVIVGFRGQVAGYSNGELNAAIGSINVVSPLLELFGLGNANDYFIESVYWGNLADITEFAYVHLNAVRYELGPLAPVPGGTVWLRRILDYPEDLAIANLSTNFERPDGSWFFNDSADALLSAGLYQITGDGMGNLVYDIIPPRSVTHRDSIGAPTVQPTRAGTIDIDDLGRQWNAAGTVHRTITPPTGTTEVLPDSELGSQHVDNVSGFADLADRGGLGAWFAQNEPLNIIQVQGLGPPLNIDLVGTFHDAFIWIIENVPGGDTPANQFFRDDTTILGSFARERDALLELQFVLSGVAFPAPAIHQYIYVDSTHFGVGSNFRRVTSYNPGQFLRDDDFHWNPQADQTFVAQATAAHAAQQNAHILPRRLLPLNPADGQYAVYNGATGLWDAVPPPSGGGTAFSIPGLDDQDTPVAAADLFAVWDASDGATEKVTAGVIRTFMQNGLAGGLSLSDADPADVGDTAIPGDGSEASRDNHGHRVPTDSTLEFNANDELAVNVHDVIEHVSHHIRYYTNVNDYSSSAGASVGQVFTTSRYKKVITKIEADFNPLGGADEYLIRLDEVEDNNDIKAKLVTSNTRSTAGGTAGIRTFRFHDGAGEPGVTINGGIRLGVLLSRLGDSSDTPTQAVHGAQAGNSPNEDYDDGSLDFALVNDVVYQHINPGVGTSTHSHGTDIRANFKIYYTLIIEHGDLVGAAPELDQDQVEDATDETFGTVSGQRLSQAVAAHSPGGGGGGGGPNKVVSQIVTGTAPVSTTLGASGLSADITPSDDTKKVLVQVQGGYLDTGGASSDSYALRLIRGGNNILTPSSLRARNFDGPVAFTYLDTPASDAELTYSLNWAATEAGVGLEASATNPMVMILEEVD